MGMLPILIIVAIVVVILGVNNARERELDDETAQNLELTPTSAGESHLFQLGESGDWGLSRERLWDDMFAFGFTMTGGSPKMGELEWCHETERDGRPLLVAREIFRENSTNGSSTTTEFYVVAARVDTRETFFVNGGDEDGTLTGPPAGLLRPLVQDYARAVMLYDGLLVIRFEERENMQTALDDAAEFARSVAPAPAIEAGPELPPGTWQQPPSATVDADAPPALVPAAPQKPATQWQQPPSAPVN